VLQDKSLWDTDLSLLPGFTQNVTDYLENMLDNGVKHSLESFFLRHPSQVAETNEIL